MPKFLLTQLLQCVLLAACTAQPFTTQLSPADFKLAYQSDTSALLLDVRTINEVSKGMIPGASHIDFFNTKFKEQVNTIDKQRTVYVYCASGARSADAAAIMRQMGFAKVYEMNGGLIAWKLDNLPVTTIAEHAASSDNVMTTDAFAAVIKTNPLVLIDFYAPWCAPCKIMKPALDSMSNEMSDSVMILTLNADDHLHLMKALKFNTIPQVLLYRQGKEMHRQDGFMRRDEMEALIRNYY